MKTIQGYREYYVIRAGERYLSNLKPLRWEGSFNDEDSGIIGALAFSSKKEADKAVASGLDRPVKIQKVHETWEQVISSYTKQEVVAEYSPKKKA